MRAIMDQYNVQIIPRPKQKNFHAVTIVVKGCEWECARVKEATLLLMDHLCKVSRERNILLKLPMLNFNYLCSGIGKCSGVHDHGDLSPASRHGAREREY